MISPETTLRSIALEQPVTIRVFEKLHLDYCCGGNRPLSAACAEKGLPLEDVVKSLEQSIAGEPELPAGFADVSLPQLIRYIIATHHEFVRSELPPLQIMARKVAGKHGQNHPEVTLVERNLSRLSEELIDHLSKEEQILFPYIQGLERSRSGGEKPHSCFGTVASPIRMMVMEHEGAAALLEEMRRVTNGFEPWEGACPTSAGLYYRLAQFERDLHRHVHLENNLLFPRALQLEKETLAAQ